MAFIFVVSIVTTFTLNNGAKDVDLTEKIEMEAPAPEFPAALPEAGAPEATETPAN